MGEPAGGAVRRDDAMSGSRGNVGPRLDHGQTPLQVSIVPFSLMRLGVPEVQSVLRQSGHVSSMHHPSLSGPQSSGSFAHR